MIDTSTYLIALLVLVIAIIVYYYYYYLQPAHVYMKIDPPPDVDKDGVANPPIVNDNTCWMATAANMLAGAGYGNGASLQARANDIYGDLVTWQTSATNPTGKADGGWTDTALSWWLSSVNNTWPTNPYTDVTIYGNKSPKYPWADPNGARFIGNELRRCQMVGLSISWPTPGASIGSGGHAITCWGDNGGDDTLTNNPTRVRVTDSDTDAGGDVQSYAYDAYTNPNPGDANEGNGWYINYDNNHPYIKHIVTLCPLDTPSGPQIPIKVVGSYRIHQDRESDAIDLHYRVGTDTTILSYKTTIDWQTENQPSITENGPPRKILTVDWDLSDKPVPYCTWVTITTEFILPRLNAIWYDDVHFTYLDEEPSEPLDIDWEVDTPTVANAETILNVSGGYVVGSFDVLNASERVVGQYRFIHEYSFNQNPEKHALILSSKRGYSVANVHVGHSYGYLTIDRLWEFEEWMYERPGEIFELTAEPTRLEIDWDGRLPYPEGEDITGRIPGKERSFWQRFFGKWLFRTR